MQQSLAISYGLQLSSGDIWKQVSNCYLFYRQGRVFGFAHSIEQAASPLTAFFIGPIAELVFIPFMTTGTGVELIGDWFGVGPGRGMALVFITAGVIGLIITTLARRSRYFGLLSKRYLQASPTN